MLRVVHEICRFESVELTKIPVPVFETPESARQLIVTFEAETVTVGIEVFDAITDVLADESP